MLKKVIISILAVGLIVVAMVSCKPAPSVGADGYEFGQPQFVNKQVQIDVVTYDSTAALYAKAQTYGVKDPLMVAFSVVHAPKFDKCTIHMIDPTVNYQPEFIGHEFTHCLYGQWHTSNDLFK